MNVADVVIPPWVRAVALFAGFAMAGVTGAAVNGWRIKAGQAEAMAEKVDRIHALELAAKDHDSAIAQLRTAADAANTARQRAEREAIAQRAAAKKRDDWISKLTGSCGDNLKEAWGRL
ncbi:hypothetical protein [Uliginosibacterium sp. 31-12]|uniref:hypothetical protein n=1 Tax=Uliginosibacterium sp. 31-12 TaxID=3062781 RepID=UPI0026E3F20D|nr:hypothetical protein [Uliginosibacterium sp. 31-12]MDO6385565.1 hypothetical protein [Uliginosibacterium sp. 31-12]